MAEAIKMGTGGGRIKNSFVEELYAADEDVKPNTFCNLVTGSLSEETFANGEKALSTSNMYNIDLGNNKILFYNMPSTSTPYVYLRVLDTNTNTFGTKLQLTAAALNSVFVRDGGNTIDLFSSHSSRYIYVDVIQVAGVTLSTNRVLITEDSAFSSASNVSIRSLYELSGIPAYVVFYATSSGYTTTTYYLTAVLVSCVNTPTIKTSLSIFSAVNNYISVYPEDILEQLQIIKCNNRYFLFTYMTTSTNTENLNTSLYEIMTSTNDVTNIKRLSRQQTNTAWGTSGRNRPTNRACSFYKVSNNNIFFVFIINYEDYDGDTQDGGYVEVLIDTESGTYTLQNQSFPTGVYGHITAFDKIDDNYLCISNDCANVSHKSLFVCTIDTAKTTAFAIFSSPLIIPAGENYSSFFTQSSVRLLQNLYNQDYYCFTAPHSTTILNALVKMSNNIFTLIAVSASPPTFSGVATTDIKLLDYKYTPKHLRGQVGYCRYTYSSYGINIEDDTTLFLLQTSAALNAYKSALICQKIKKQNNSIIQMFTTLRVLNSNLMSLGGDSLGGAFAYEKNTSNIFTYSETSPITTDYTYNVKLTRVAVAVKKVFDLSGVVVLPYTKCTTTKKGKVYIPISE